MQRPDRPQTRKASAAQQDISTRPTTPESRRFISQGECLAPLAADWSRSRAQTASSSALVRGDSMAGAEKMIMCSYSPARLTPAWNSNNLFEPGRCRLSGLSLINGMSSPAQPPLEKDPDPPTCGTCLPLGASPQRLACLRSRHIK
jgi:hypothetical protein